MNIFRTALFIFVLFPFSLFSNETDFFSDSEALKVTLKVDFKELLGTFSKYNRRVHKKEYLSATFHYSRGGEDKVFEVGVQKRGKSRLESQFPPLMLKFNKKENKGTDLEGLSTLKMVTNGSLASYGQKRVRDEYLLYRLYNEMTPLSLRVKLLEITYVDTSRTYETFSSLAFVIENPKSLAKRANLFYVSKKLTNDYKGTPWNEKYVSMVYTFNFFINNDDFNLSDSNYDQLFKPFNHKGLYPNNIKVFFRDGKLIPVAYDFDLGGLYKSSEKRIKSSFNFYFKHFSSEKNAEVFGHLVTLKEELTDVIKNSKVPDLKKVQMVQSIEDKIKFFETKIKK
jgi:hypothetical protein